MSDIPDNAPAPRLCIIVKWPDFEGYGFNLHAEKSKPGQYIGKVDANSPAEVAGLQEGDRIIEVNGANIANENHKQVVQRIKAVANETKLLVVDATADKYYKSKNIVVRGSQHNVIVKSSVRAQKTPPREPLSAPAVTNGHREDVDNRSVSSAASSTATSEASTQPQPATAPEELVGSIPEEAAVEEVAEAARSRSPSPSSHHDADPAFENIPPPMEDEHSIGREERDERHSVSSQGSDTGTGPGEVVPGSSEGSDTGTGPGEVVPGEELAPHAEDKESKEEPAPCAKDTVSEEERTDKPAPPSIEVEAESDLEAEYDNVELAGGRPDGDAAPAPAPVLLRSSSTSSHGSHSSHGSGIPQSPMSTSPTPPPSLEPVTPSAPPASAPAPAPAPAAAPAPAPAAAPTPTAKPPPPSVASNNNYNSSGLNLNMSAAEMRAMLARKKKTDPRKDTVDLKKKYEIIQNM